VVVFENGEIIYVGPAAGAPEPADGAIIREYPDRIILPGLVNTHTHIGMSLFRNLLEDLPSSDWFTHELEAERHRRSALAYDQQTLLGKIFPAASADFSPSEITTGASGRAASRSSP
jgi:5-methylthioadenosine/S-adenosylhomocysteine deaminase